MKNNSVIKQMVILICSVFFLAFIFDLSVESVRDPSFVFLIVCIAALVIAFYDKITSPGIFFTMLTGVLLKITYVLYTPVWCRQHDVIDFGAGEGHAAYIEYFLSHRSLPDFDPRSIWAFFQPPLHHMISAVWMRINMALSLSQARVFKNVQILPLLYMCILMFVADLICKELAMSRSARLITLLVTSFHPIYVIMSGSINNDALSVMLSVVAFYIAICWYMYPTTGKIILLALSIGLAMSAKLSSALVAPPIAAMMIYKIVTDTDKFKAKEKVISYILEILAFAVIVFPLGLWWPVRNKILFDMPVNYIPEVGEHLEKTGIIPTLLDVRTASPFLYMKSNGYAYDEYNLILASLKSSLFGEGSYPGGAMAVCGFILLFLLCVVTVLQMIAAIRTVFVKEASPDTGIRILLGVSVITYIAGFTAFALSGMNLSAMDPRYCAPVVVILSLFLGFWHDRIRAKGGRIMPHILTCSAVAFAVCSAVFYIMVGTV